MAWRQHSIGMAGLRRGRGLSGMNMDAIKKPTVNDRPRQFGTELPSNIIDNQIHRLAKKRTFQQFNSEQKEEENARCNKLEEARPVKKRRYNLRSQAKLANGVVTGRGHKATGKENKPQMDLNVKTTLIRNQQKVNINKPQIQVSKPNKKVAVNTKPQMNKGMKSAKVKMQEPENESDEDIDLAPYRTRKVRREEKERKEKKEKEKQSMKRQQSHCNEQQSHHDQDHDPQQNEQQQKRSKQHSTKQPALRRSLRLKNKRERIAQHHQYHEHEEKEHEVLRPLVEVKEVEVVVDSTLMECDHGNIDDDLHFPDYAAEIVMWYRECEESEFQRNLIKEDYISTKFQPDLNDAMRCILLDWLFNVHRRFQLGDRTLYMAVYLLDAYLSKVTIKRNQLQLIGCAAMWVASKYHEIYAPEATDFVYISDSSFEVEKLFSMEVEILVNLEFKFADIITPLCFLERYLQVVAHPLWTKYKSRGTKKAMKDGQRYVTLVTGMSRFFGDLALFDCTLMSTYKPSLIAAASMCFAILSISLYSRWPEFLETATGYTHEQLIPAIKRLNDLRQVAVDDTNGKITSLKKMHRSVTKWLVRLNLESALNADLQV